MVQHACAYSNRFGAAAATALVALGLVVVPPDKASPVVLRTEVAAVQLQAAVETQVSGIVNSVPAAAIESVGPQATLTTEGTASNPFTDLVGTVLRFAIGGALLLGTPIFLPVAVIASPIVNPYVCLASMFTACSKQDPITGYFNFVLSFFRVLPVGSAAAVALQRPVAASTTATAPETTPPVAAGTAPVDSVTFARRDSTGSKSKSQVPTRRGVTTDRQSPSTTTTPVAATVLTTDTSPTAPAETESNPTTPTGGIDGTSSSRVSRHARDDRSARGATTPRFAKTGAAAAAGERVR